MDDLGKEDPAHSSGELRAINIILSWKMITDFWCEGLSSLKDKQFWTLQLPLFSKNFSKSCLFQNIRIKTAIRTNMETEALFLAIMIILSFNHT